MLNVEPTRWRRWASGSDPVSRAATPVAGGGLHPRFAERKNGWQMAEWLGEASPHAVQHLLGRADWDAEALRDDFFAYVT